ncbi:MAG: sodium:proton antiporter [Pedosphaera sp.]|nr:sodium:proton antiporter [Pedosphaera sp.]MSU43578.1 sodium:proton antiporter [Pedosphaera sp.]
MYRRGIILFSLLGMIAVLAAAESAAPASTASANLPGAKLGALWCVPFVGLLLSMAILPLAAPQFWHHHFGKVTAGWALAYLLPSSLLHGMEGTAAQLAHATLAEYLPFLILIGALFVIAGGVYLRGDLRGNPATNTLLLAIGTGIASIAGTTGAAMLLVRTVIRANAARPHNAHVLIFFIFLVANIGGALSPLGDPPLFLGFLKGVSFFWPTTHLLLPMLMTAGLVLGIFWAVDSHFYRKEPHREIHPAAASQSLAIEGGINLLLLVGVVAVVLMSGLWKPGTHWMVLGTQVELQGLARDLLLIGLAALSLKLTPASCREANAFSWGPILEVAKLFAGIFVTIIPVIAMLRAGEHGAFAGVTKMVTGPDGHPNNAAYFWLTGVLSSFLDNAPTYLVFFNTAGGDAQKLMEVFPRTLMAISLGAVFMGANTYIGNAPNFMVKSIAEERGVRMPSFLGYMAWSFAVLIPIFLLVTWVFF